MEARDKAGILCKRVGQLIRCQSVPQIYQVYEAEQSTATAFKHTTEHTLLLSLNSTIMNSVATAPRTQFNLKS